MSTSKCKIIDYPVGAIVKTTRFLQVGQFVQGSLGIIKKQYSHAQLDAFDALAAANPDFKRTPRPADLYEITLVQQPDESYQTFLLSTQNLESKDFILHEGDETNIKRKIEILREYSPYCDRCLLV